MTAQLKNRIKKLVSIFEMRQTFLGQINVIALKHFDFNVYFSFLPFGDLVVPLDSPIDGLM